MVVIIHWWTIRFLNYKEYYDKRNIQLKVCGVGDSLHRICFTKLNLQIL